MSTREERLTTAPMPEPPPVAPSASWRPAHAERIVVAVMSGLLAGVVAGMLVYWVLDLKVPYGPGPTGGNRYSTRNQGTTGAIAGAACFAATALSIYFISLVKIRRRIRGRFAVTLGGACVVGFLGMQIAYTSVRELSSWMWINLADRQALQAVAGWDANNGTKANLAGWGAGFTCAGFSGVSLYKLYDRMGGQQASATKGNEEKGG